MLNSDNQRVSTKNCPNMFQRTSMIQNLTPPLLQFDNTSNALSTPINTSIPANPIHISKEKQPLPFSLNVNREYSNTVIKNPKYSSLTPEMAPALLTGFKYYNRTVPTDNDQTAPPAIIEFITITKEERQEGLIDAAK